MNSTKPYDYQATQNFHSQMKNLLLEERQMYSSLNHKINLAYFDNERRQHAPLNKFAQNYPKAYDLKIKHYL